MSAAEPPSDADRPLDPGRLAELRALAGPDAPDLAAEVARIYLDTAGACQAALEAAAQAGRPEEVAAEAHRLKGSSLNVGALGLAALCEAAERAGRDERRVDPAAVQEIAAELARVREALVAEFPSA